MIVRLAMSAMFVLMVLAFFTGCDEDEPTVSTVDTADSVDTESGEPHSTLPTCEQLEASFQPCGGDIVGTWDVDMYCLKSTFDEYRFFPFDECEHTAFTVSLDFVSGQFVFNQDGTGRRSIQGTQTFTLFVSDDCLNAIAASSGGRRNPEQVCQGISDDMDDGSCTYATPTCTCDQVAAHRDETFNWQSTNNVITIDDSEGNQSTMEYCVEYGKIAWRNTVEMDPNSKIIWIGAATKQ